MPNVLRILGFRFFFFSGERNEPPHIHVWSSGRVAIYWLSPVSLRDNQGYNPREIERIRRIVIGSRDMMLRRCHEYFDHLA